MITDKQYRKLIKVFNYTGKISMSSLKAGINRKTGAKYIKAQKCPFSLKKPHTWRTRKDPFEQVRDEIANMLEYADDLEPLTIFRYLQEKYPGKFDDGQLRTLQRHVKEWRMTAGPDKLLSIPQVHLPGKLMELDWTSMNALNITICGEPFKHLLCHTVLTYSNWEWAQIAYSESFLSLKKSFQAAVFQLGAVPEILQTDNSTTATHRVEKGKKARDFNHEYKTFLDHYKVKPRSINVSSPDENGDIESANGHLKKRIEQHLLIRGSRDFSSIEKYNEFLVNILIRANSNRAKKVQDELEVMHELPRIRLPEYTEEEKTVSSFGTVRVKEVTYSVPSRLKGCKIRVRAYEDKIKFFSSRIHLLTVDRKKGKGYSINYRHVIESLRRKPGAFANYRYKDQLFPTHALSMAYEYFVDKYNEHLASKEYLEILHLAAHNGEEKVSNIIIGILEGGEKLSIDAVKQKLNIPMNVPKVNILIPSLGIYDRLLKSTQGGLYV